MNVLCARELSAVSITAARLEEASDTLISVCFRFSATRGAVGVLSGCAGEELQISMPTCLGSQILCFTGESIITCQKKVKQIGNTSLNTCVE